MDQCSMPQNPKFPHKNQKSPTRWCMSFLQVEACLSYHNSSHSTSQGIYVENSASCWVYIYSNYPLPIYPNYSNYPIPIYPKRGYIWGPMVPLWDGPGLNFSWLPDLQQPTLTDGPQWYFGPPGIGVSSESMFYDSWIVQLFPFPQNTITSVNGCKAHWGKMRVRLTV